MTYNPILADRWTCGKMMKYLEDRIPVDACQILGTLRDQLQSEKPNSRPPLKKILDAYRRDREGRMTRPKAEADACAASVRLLVRHSIYVCVSKLNASKCMYHDSDNNTFKLSTCQHVSYRIKVKLT